MEVFAFTIFMSLAFAALFAVFFIAERSQRHRRPIEQLALLPLEGPTQTEASKPAPITRLP